MVFATSFLVTVGLWTMTMSAAAISAGFESIFGSIVDSSIVLAVTVTVSALSTIWCWKIGRNAIEEWQYSRLS